MLKHGQEEAIIKGYNAEDPFTTPAEFLNGD